ncbi:MAG: hypothetical protein EBS01_12060 [Verrucomicrobia bacterium]|nr:hypothetical protein [Verrucomicrobiota bacterium]
MYNATKHLKELCTPERRLCFYPSCGDRLLSPLTQLRSDVLVCADYFPRTMAQRVQFWSRIVGEFSENGVPLVLFKATKSVRVAWSGKKWLFLFFLDNNAVLERIAKAGWRIAQFVGLNDGCRESGNYECVHDEPFLSKILPLMEDGGDYFTDHAGLPFLSDLAIVMKIPSLFAPHIMHQSGRHLFLSRMLFVRGFRERLPVREEVPALEVFELKVGDEIVRPSSWQNIGDAAAGELAKMSPFFVRYMKRMIAHYHVTAHGWLPEAAASSGKEAGLAPSGREKAGSLFQATLAAFNR